VPHEGIIPESVGPPRAGVLKLGRELGSDGVILVNLSGRGDKDVETASHYFGLVQSATTRVRQDGQGEPTASRPDGYLPVGYPSVDVSIEAMRAMVDGGAT